MPTSLPVRTRAQSQRRIQIGPHVVSCAALGAAAVGIAAFVGWVCGDPVGALLTLVMVVALLVALFVRGRRTT
jgi:hypothetical protein